MKITPRYYGMMLGVAAIGGFCALSLISSDPIEIVADIDPAPISIPKVLGSAVDSAEEISGGGTTIADTTMRSYGRMALNTQPIKDKWGHFREGKKVFDRDWSRARQSPLGPLFSSTSCNGCHDKDGRGRPPADGELPESMVVQLAMLVGDGEQSPDPEYGWQLDYRTMHEEEEREGYCAIEYEEIEGRFADGASFTLRKPRIEFRDLAHGDFRWRTRFSARVAPILCGLGLLEAVPVETIHALADPNDTDGDGISGRPNYVFDVATGRKELGRFGWKAGQPSVAQQIAKAFHDDMGITTAYFPDTSAIVRNAGFSRRPVELDLNDFDRILFYTKLLAVPARRDWKEPAVLRGKVLFHETGCARCHAPRLVTGEMDGYPELSNQVIRPYTDLLLHDMGEGLADDRPDGLASGREWRTPPLWGIGLVHVVNEHTFFLHDGRARNLEEAILWHGGEAIASQRFYRRLPKSDREALLAFLGSL